jgi:hypothetical protein
VLGQAGFAPPSGACAKIESLRLIDHLLLRGVQSWQLDLDDRRLFASQTHLLKATCRLRARTRSGHEDPEF